MLPGRRARCCAAVTGARYDDRYSYRAPSPEAPTRASDATSWSEISKQPNVISSALGAYVDAEAGTFRIGADIYLA